MEPDSTICDLCNNHILSKCFEIHKRACEKKKQGNSTQLSKIKQELKDLIPCSECGEMVSFSVYGIHIEECVGRQLTKCERCRLLYPTFLIEEHLNVCEAQYNPTVNSSKEFQIKQEINYEQEEQEDDMDFKMDEMIMELAAEVENEDQPLTLQLINLIPKKAVRTDDQCSICYCSIPAKSEVLRMTCPHVFHLRCISAWLQKNPHCPMCRRFVLK